MTFIRVKPGHEIDPIDLADRFQVNLNPGRPNRRPPGIGIAVDGFLGFTAAFTVGSGDRPVQSQILRFSIFLRGQHLHGGTAEGSGEEFQEQARRRTAPKCFFSVSLFLLPLLKLIAYTKEYTSKLLLKYMLLLVI